MDAVEVLLQNRTYIYVREADKLLILATSKGEMWFRINATAVFMLQLLLQGKSPESVIEQVVISYKAEIEMVTQDLNILIQSIIGILEDPDSYWDELEAVPSDWAMELPIMVELTITTRCNARCQKCYMSAVGEDDTQAETMELPLVQIKTIVDRLCEEAHVREVIVSGGEPTLRDDIFEIIAYCKSKGLRVNMITNGVKAGTVSGFAKALAEAGLDTAQVSLDSPVERTHDVLVKRKFYRFTVAGLKALHEAGVYAYVNSTLCKLNAEELLGMPRFLKDMGIKTWSANGLIPSGRGIGNLDSLGMSYGEFAVWVPKLKEAADQAGIEFSWILPVPYCLLPLPAMGFQEKGCTAANVIAITNAKGQFVACNNLPDEVLGDMLDPTTSFADMWNSVPARWWRERQFMPEPCKECPFNKTCCGACPQYWRHFGDIKEIASARGVQIPEGYTIEWRLAFENRPRISV